jgi:putative tryptophan/tyrosine transport system substrate-binding protein
MSAFDGKANIYEHRFKPFQSAVLTSYDASSWALGQAMRRRDLIKVIAGSAAAWPLAARAQQPERMPRIGVLMPYASDDPEIKSRLAGFHQTLEQLGWSEDHNVRIDYRFASGRSDQYLALAQELLALQPNLIVAVTTPVAVTLQRKTQAIPIVFTSVSDPIGQGLVASLARPGGNLTGVLLYEAGIVGKWLAMLPARRAQVS